MIGGDYLCTNPKIVRWDPVHESYFFSGKYWSSDFKDALCQNLDEIAQKALKSSTGEVVKPVLMVGCGQCVECRLSKSKEWSTRMCCEYLTHHKDSCFFLTLTYADNNLPIGSKGNPTTVKKHISEFMKNFRSSQKYHFNIDNIRFYGSTEYGDERGRPHLHIIVFGACIPDLDIWFYNRFNQPVFTSKYLSSVWKFGLCPIGAVSFNSCAYVARYVMKKKNGRLADFYDERGIESESSLMSLKPGIGYDYLVDHFRDIYVAETDEGLKLKDKIYLPDDFFLRDEKTLKVKNISLSPPKFFDDKLEHLDSELYDFVKSSRSYAHEKERFDGITLKATEVFKEDYFSEKEEKYRQVAKKLRKYIV